MDHKKNVYRKTKGAKIMLTHHVTKEVDFLKVVRLVFWSGVSKSTKEESPKNLPVSLKSKIASWLIMM